MVLLKLILNITKHLVSLLIYYHYLQNLNSKRKKIFSTSYHHAWSKMHKKYPDWIITSSKLKLEATPHFWYRNKLKYFFQLQLI